MPTSTKYRENANSSRMHSIYGRTYSDGKQYANISTAYEFPTVYPGRNKTKTTVQKPIKAEPDKSALSRGVATVLMFSIVLVALCFAVIYRQTVILEANQEIKALEKQYNEIVSSNQVMQAKIDLSFKKGEVEQYAREELGMVIPEAGQIFYIDMEMNDTGGEGSISDSAMNAVSGIQGTLVNAFRVLK